MDDAQARATLITVCAGLARLQVHLMRNRRMPPIYRERRVGELDPPSPWLDARDPDTLVNTAGDAVALALAHLLAMVDSSGSIDPRHACLCLQHIQGRDATAWGTVTLRMARRLGYTLADTPRDEFHSGYLEQYVIPRAGRGPQHQR